MYNYKLQHRHIAKLEGDIGVQLDQWDNAHNIKHDDLARAVYVQWRAEKTGVPELLSIPYRKLLEDNGLLHK